MGKYVELNLTKKIHTPEFFPSKIWLVFKVTEKNNNNNNDIYDRI